MKIYLLKIYLLSCLLIPLLLQGQPDSIAIIARSKINTQSENPVHSILLYVEKPDKSYTYNEEFRSPNQVGNIKLENSQFRIASSTKLFVSAIILQLSEEGKLTLSDKASRYLKGIDYLNFDNIHVYNEKGFSDQITIEHLLSHRSGLADIFSDKQETFFDYVMQNSARQHSPKSVVELYYQLSLNKEPHFEPDKGWYYSDMNYVLLGLIIEQIEQTTLHKSIRDRILNPLKMDDTFFEFYEPRQPNKYQVDQYVGSINFSKINTSFDWAGGGLVSTNKDLAVFIKSLFSLKLVNKQSLNKMIDVKFTKEHENRYGLGMYESEYNGNTYFGHYGFYGSYVGYSPKTNSVISYCISQATPDFSVYGFINEVLGLMK
ncbi:MAG: serine hydrolase domain-containing protein [Cyclobacteriaceae bacterium]